MTYVRPNKSFLHHHSEQAPSKDALLSQQIMHLIAIQKQPGDLPFPPLQLGGRHVHHDALPSRPPRIPGAVAWSQVSSLELQVEASLTSRHNASASGCTVPAEATEEPLEIPTHAGIELEGREPLEIPVQSVEQNRASVALNLQMDETAGASA
eukprot:CAMPEP_0172912626 /NCGR_PEP_ID=MMETSP1075-20121228/188794_1 /TAXON_ID=2916 /ORGANISM="Ceratium fusus, Strain PA161109" /LENGTH=152 /DNA_ID=CAMNT_0013771163 /DNA_START=72 /DNA_END=526 /DNA_ORIENTATION=+